MCIWLWSGVNCPFSLGCLWLAVGSVTIPKGRKNPSFITPHHVVLELFSSLKGDLNIRWFWQWHSHASSSLFIFARWCSLYFWLGDIPSTSQHTFSGLSVEWAFCGFSSCLSQPPWSITQLICLTYLMPNYSCVQKRFTPDGWLKRPKQTL